MSLHNAWVQQFVPEPPYQSGKFVPPCGPLDAKLAFVGEAPGDVEVDKEVPFSGPSGWELDKMLLEAQINRSNCFLSNVSLEHPPDNLFQKLFYETKTAPKRTTPTKRLLEWHSCIRAQLRAVNPNVVVALGNEALFALTGLTGIYKWRGSILRSHDGHKVVPTIHPSAIMLQWRMRTVVIHDFKRALEESATPNITIPIHIYRIKPTINEVTDYLNWIIENKPAITIDIETHPKSQFIVAFGLGHIAGQAMCIPLSRSSGNYWKLENEALIVSLLCKILHDPTIPKIGHNLVMFDVPYIEKEWGVSVQNIAFDTMHVHHNLYAEMPHTLQFLTSIHTKPVMNYYKEEGKHWEKHTGEEQFWIYNCKDIVATKQSLDDLWQESTPSLQQFYKEVLLPLSLVCKKIQDHGWNIDTEKRLEVIATTQKYIDRIQFLVDGAVDNFSGGIMKSLNVRSPLQMKKLFYDELGLPIQKKRVGRSWVITCDKEAINKFKLITPSKGLFFDFVLKLIQMKKELSFLETPLTNNRLYTQLSVTGTETGRLNSKEDCFGRGTNLQNVKNKLRVIFLPDPGYVLVEADLKQAEAQVVAVLAELWDLVEMFKDGTRDVHWWNAIRIFNLESTLQYDKTNKEHERLRYLAKRIIHASNYGMTWKKLQRVLMTDAGVILTNKEAEAYLEAYHNIYPGIRNKFHAWIEQELRKNRALTTPHGRYRMFYDRWSDTLIREGYAHYPQSTVVDTTNKAMIRFNSYCEAIDHKARILHQNHDSIIFQVIPQYLQEACLVLKECMETPVNIKGYNLSIATEFKSGMNWAAYHRVDNPNGLKEYKIERG